ncbi:AI-2E family transporter [Chelatococcus asaccharovorans]|uniref:Putative PurR-regulated permease PerM n=1 Tax=Chelatococcus asaccharovorans TaxID=28210 RepID=A0A2V3U5C3_9HYPH|nr:AI-2E family transporter [Chelatococcus asaccharovorans]MBS7703975.1 AI-2E family transporter [Chelatococcus asaccharovorans]PXW58139.1 putative PurR-regulated permease PerM [Chelatococcus asaccharovorans]CAH1667230.1 putative permease often clustered with de novo purine synthesis [Chelatococcus asaccharovorans]CAH1681089.1 putative permease often clustered with de novo purine synthesis [Chelatococcus asaccharovorans]
MSFQRQVGFWVTALAVAILALVLLRGILLPFVAGLALAYLLDPLANRFERMGIRRLPATIIILCMFVLLFILVLMVIVPVAANQLAAFVAKLPATVARLQQLAVDHGRPLIERLGGPGAIGDIEGSLGNIMSQGASWFAGFLQSLWSGGQALVGIFSLLVITPVVAFYLLVDWERMVNKVDSWLPRRHLATIRQLAREMDRAIAGFLRGQALVCLILGTFYAVGLSLVGLNFGVLIGLLSGILTFIPYVGSLTGLVLSGGVAIVQFWPDWTWIAATFAVFFVGQFIEGNILSPKLVGDAVGVHPVWLMFALLAFGSLFGFLGLLLAVPIAAAIGVLMRFALRQYMDSPFYDSRRMVLSAEETREIQQVKVIAVTTSPEGGQTTAVEPRQRTDRDE